MTQDSTWDARIARLDAAGRARLRRNAEAQARDADPKRVAEARVALDALDAAEAAERQADRAAAEGPLAGRVTRAFERMPPNETERMLIQAVLDAPGSTSTALSERVGYGNMAWQLHFGTLCKARTAHLGVPDGTLGNGQPFWSGLLCDLAEGSLFTLKPEAEAALRDLGFSPQA